MGVLTSVSLMFGLLIGWTLIACLMTLAVGYGVILIARGLGRAMKSKNPTISKVPLLNVVPMEEGTRAHAEWEYREEYKNTYQQAG